MTVQVSVEALGPPGIPHEVHAVAGPEPEVPGDPAQDIAALNDTSEREFRVVAHLAKEPGSFSQDLDASVDPSRGASLIRVPEHVEGVVLQTTLGEVRVVLNARHEFAGLAFTSRARSKQEVLAQYSEVVAPVIDHMSFLQDVPLFVRSVAWWDEKNRVIGASYISPFRDVEPSGQVAVFDGELRPLYALYREGLTSGSVFYQFLCYVKILEGVFRWLMPRVRREAESKAVQLPKIHLRLQDHPHLEGDSRRFIGRRIEQIFNDHLQVEFRNAIAHFTQTGEDPIVTSNYMSGAVVSSNLFLARMCARHAITAGEQLVRFLKTR